MSKLSPPIAIHGLFRFPASFLGFFVLAAVPGFFALSQCDLYFSNPFTKINAKGDDRQTLGFGTSGQLVNFAAVQEQLAIAEGFVIPGAAGRILRDVGVDQERPAGFKVHEGIANVGFALAQSFHFGAMQHQARFELLKNVVVVGSGAILRDDLLARLLAVPAFLGLLVWL